MAHEHQKPGFMEKIKERLPGHHHKPDLSGETEETVPRGSEEGISHVNHTKVVAPRVEKKSMVQKMKDRFSGHHDKENSGPDAHETPRGRSEEYDVKVTNVDDTTGPDYGTRKAGAKKPGMARNNSF